MTIYPAFFFISAILTGKFLIRYFDRVNACFIGALFLVVYLIWLGLLEYSDSQKTIKGLALFFHVFGGIGNGINSVATVAVLSGYKE